MTNNQTPPTDIIEITESAIDKIAELLASRDEKNLSIRVVLKGALPGGKYQSEFKFVKPENIHPIDLIQDTGKFNLVFDIEGAEKIRGAKVDFDEQVYSAGFHIEYPQQILDGMPAIKDDWTDPLAIKVQAVITNEINPGVAAHGGWVHLHKIEDNKAIVEMGGGCQGCGISEVTLRNGIERLILEKVPEIVAIIDTTDHDEGDNPYYPSNTDENKQSALN